MKISPRFYMLLTFKANCLYYFKNTDELYVFCLDSIE